ncbi:hypothetical protein VE03_04028 [Pseudogymnoascus sp. 23342-1-I1]|nr:hypothetical protein VE03_04028 [Pseudogymnoascus sp. 23342-1-I1]
MSTGIVPHSSGSGSNAFTQQGTVDWTTLSRSTVNFTVEILSRLSKAGVEPITAAMGQAIFAGFNLDPDGQKRFSDAVSRLKAFSSYGDIMWFGFGVKHIVRTLSETEQGATCAAICACLSVSYDKFFCSKVLKALADQQKAPNSLMPSISQWAALANICSGAVLGSRFPQLVEIYSRLAQPFVGDTRHALQETTSANALASALLELAKVSSGTVRSVTFIGGLDCGWLAALAQWLLSLRVDIITADGSVVYSSRTSADTSYYPQVSIVQQLSFRNRSNTTLIKQSVFVMAGQLFFGATRDVTNGQGHFFAAGRSEWSTILRDTFGAKLDALLHPEVIQDFAELLSIELFTGCPDVRHIGATGLSAASGSGICAYLPSLQNPTTSPREQLRVTVVAGHIEWNSKIFSVARDRKSESGSDPESLGGLASSFIDDYGSNVTLKLLVEETFHGPSSQVLLTSAKFLPETQATESPAEPDDKVSTVVKESNSGVLPTPQTAQSPSEPDHTIPGNNQLSDSSAIPGKAAPASTSQTAQPPLELGLIAPDAHQQESDSSAIPSQAIQGGIPHRGRDFKSSNPSEIRRARSL